MPNRRTPAPTADRPDGSEDSPVLEQSLMPEAQTETVITAPEEPDGDAAKVDGKLYPERPYAEAVSPEHKAYLESQGFKL